MNLYCLSVFDKIHEWNKSGKRWKSSYIDICEQLVWAESAPQARYLAVKKDNDHPIWEDTSYCNIETIDLNTPKVIYTYSGTG